LLHRFGDRERFAIEVGAVVSGNPTTGLRKVDLWVDGRELCCVDNNAFVPHFCLQVESFITQLLSDDDRNQPHLDMSPEENHRRLCLVEYEFCRPYIFMDWGPTTDNLRSFLFRRSQDAIITVEFSRTTHSRPDELGQVFMTVLPQRDVLRILHQAVCVLRRGT
jgi:hypothetical protein